VWLSVVALETNLLPESPTDSGSQPGFRETPIFAKKEIILVYSLFFAFM
jgi:hypothetical protein